MDDRQYIRISELLLYCYDGTASRGHVVELEALLDHNRQALEYCVEISRELNYFHCLGQVPLSQPESVQCLDTEFMSELGPQQQMDLLEDFAEYEKHAAAIEIVEPEESKEFEPIKNIRYDRPARTINKFSLATAVLCAAATLLMIIYVKIAPPASYEVAMISDSMNAEWSSKLPTSQGTRITSHSKPIRLTRGVIKIRTDDEVEIVLEAPSEFYFSSYSEVSMNYGRLFARVSEQGYGFTVVTPSLKVVDLGTEFGVLADIEGKTEVHLYKGKANVFAGEKHEPKISQLLAAGSAVKVDFRTSRNSSDFRIQEIALDKQALVRNIVSKATFIWKGQKALRLTDLILEGNGFGTSSLEGIEYNPTTGDVVPYGYGTHPSYREGPGKLIGIPGSPYLDAIFVPGSEDAEVLISSAGHRFDECPTTSGLYYSNIICKKNDTFSDTVQQIYEQSFKQFADSGFLYLHSNMGLTVDLNAVRQAVPGLQIISFSAFAGIIGRYNDATDISDADVWILVDGQVRSFRQELRSDQGYDIHLDLTDKDRFLTLVVTDGGMIYSEGYPANHYDTCGFAEPVFELALP
ncbi:MAG: FecR domain-containing protein [Planctomycetes bacterium]|nr:FecR domain-containing protein [Planctomycetota bacterium]